MRKQTHQSSRFTKKKSRRPMFLFFSLFHCQSTITFEDKLVLFTTNHSLMAFRQIFLFDFLRFVQTIFFFPSSSIENLSQFLSLWLFLARTTEFIFSFIDQNHLDSLRTTRNLIRMAEACHSAYNHSSTYSNGHFYSNRFIQNSKKRISICFSLI